MSSNDTQRKSDARTRKENEEKRLNNDWINFLKSVLVTTIQFLFFMLMSSNIVYISKYLSEKSNRFGNMFPDKENFVPYGQQQYPRNIQTQQTGGSKSKSNSSSKNKVKFTQKGGSNTNVLTSFGLNEYSKPYIYLPTKDSTKDSVINKIKFILINTIKESYLYGRNIINSAFDGAISSLNQPLIIILSLIFVPVFIIGSFIWGLATGFILPIKSYFELPESADDNSVFINSNKLLSFILFFVMLFFMLFSGMLPMILGNVQAFTSIFTFLFLGVILDKNSVIDIIYNNSLTYSILYLLFIISTSFKFLNGTTSTAMVVTMIGIIAYTIRKKMTTFD